MNVSATNVGVRLTGAEQFWYVIWCIVTLGTPYLVKIVIKKATMEAMEAQRLATEPPGGGPYLPPGPSGPYPPVGPGGQYPPPGSVGASAPAPTE